MNTSMENKTFYDVANNTINYSREALHIALIWSSIIVLVIIMISFGCNLQYKEIKGYFLKPKGITIALLSQFGVMPLTAFSLARLLNLGPIESIVILLCGCCPGGNLSNVLSFALKGDLNLSIAMTGCSTMAALGMMPLLIYVYSFGLDLGQAHILVPYKNITFSILLTIIPCLIGVYVNHKWPRLSRCFVKIGAVMGIMGYIVLLVLSAIYSSGTLSALFKPMLVTSATVMPLIGYVAGYIIALLFGLPERSRRTVCMETGCQNIQLCNAILKAGFDPVVVGPLFMFPLLYAIFQLSEGLVILFMCRLLDKFTKAKDEKAELSDSKRSSEEDFKDEIEELSDSKRNSKEDFKGGAPTLALVV
uniref:Solute carrier family 10 member 1 n=1 Tax=Leptobrachium leishanense TaxID=445787 RepID=A0A8C5MYH6_9ANUR